MGGTATRYYSPRQRRDSYGIAYKVHRNVPPPTHSRVWLLCHRLLLPLHSLSGIRARVRLFSTFNLDDPSNSPLIGEMLTALPSPVRRGVGVRSFSTNNEQRFQHRRGKIFVTPWQPYMYSDARNTFSKEQGLGFASQRKKIAKSDSHVLSCLDTRKNQRRSRHKSPKINGIYTHVSQKSLQKIISPFDHL